jgi:UDP-N-acetyl-D-galactosamine dehydrogenase
MFPERLAVIGLGYVGLPLAVAFAKHFPVVGFDINEKRVQELRRGYDPNGELHPEKLRNPSLYFTTDPEDLKGCDLFIITVPTPVDRAKRPDLSHLQEASRLVGRVLSEGSVVVYESTVYPGCTEEVCIPILEQMSGLKAGMDFKVGYSPERINPGDQEHTLEKVVKVVAGQDPETTELLARIYGLVVEAGVYKAPDIRTAEAAKVIENIQRDINIALMNELAMLFKRLGLDTWEVLKAARTKWNFLPFEPGLVGGHCIPVDPYYLAYKAQEVGYHPELILAGRRINDGMGAYVARETVRLLIRAGRRVKGARVLVLGVTFKENVPDVRNTRVEELARELQEHGTEVFAYDPLVGEKTYQSLGLTPAPDPFAGAFTGGYDALILAVPHRSFRERPLEDFLALLRNDALPGVFVDVKGVLRDCLSREGGSLLVTVRDRGEPKKFTQ